MIKSTSFFKLASISFAKMSWEADYSQKLVLKNPEKKTQHVKLNSLFTFWGLKKKSLITELKLLSWGVSISIVVKICTSC